MLQFQLLKYLNYYDLIKLQKVCKDGGILCDANKVQPFSEKPYSLCYLMVMIAI